MELEEKTDEEKEPLSESECKKHRHNCTKIQLITAMFNLDLQHKLIFGWYEVR